MPIIDQKIFLKSNIYFLINKYLEGQKSSAFHPGSLDPLFLSHLGRLAKQKFCSTQKSQVCLQCRPLISCCEGHIYRHTMLNIGSMRRTTLRGHKTNPNLLKLYSGMEYKYYSLLGQTVSHAAWG